MRREAGHPEQEEGSDIFDRNLGINRSGAGKVGGTGMGWDALQRRDCLLFLERGINRAKKGRHFLIHPSRKRKKRGKPAGKKTR